VVAGLGPADLARQCWLIRTSLATRALGLREIEFASYPFPGSRVPAEPGRLIAGADAIGQHLARIAYRAPGSAEWLGVVTHRGEDWSLGPLGPDLFTGLSGLALFFGYLGDLSGEPDHTALARAALATARSQVDRRTLTRVGGAAGLGGIIFAVTQLGTLWQDGELLDYAVSLAVLAGQWAAEDEQFDFTSGSAGSIAGLRALHAVRPGQPVRDAVRACADRVVGGQVPADPGAAWLPRLIREAGVADRPLAGFAHGAAGVAWPLLAAAVLCSEQRYHDAAAAAIRYERSLYLPEAGTWRDQRRVAGGAAFDFSAWCHGAAGVGLARVLSLPYLPGAATQAEIRAAVRHTLRAGFGLNHSLCHGDIGNLELLERAGAALDEPGWREDAPGRMGAILDSIDERGWITGLPQGLETPGLLHGLAGIGYGMLRMAAPQRVPSVLTFDPPRLAGVR
jgi:type 2 lantibiotic biosynthesis protein LanM